MVSCDTSVMAYADDIHLAQFPSDLACEAARIDAATLKNWISRKPSAVFLADDERVQAGERSFFRFSYRRVMQLAITAELVAVHISPREAAWMAAAFTDTDDNVDGRRLGELYQENFTVLVVTSSGAFVVNAAAKQNWRTLYKLSPIAPSQATLSIALDLNQIDMRVRTVLGLPLLLRKGVH